MYTTSVFTASYPSSLDIAQFIYQSTNSSLSRPTCQTPSFFRKWKVDCIFKSYDKLELQVDSDIT